MSSVDYSTEKSANLTNGYSDLGETAGKVSDQTRHEVVYEVLCFVQVQQVSKSFSASVSSGYGK